MIITFLEFLGALLVIYLISQILIPAIWPRDFERNWIFKKKKPIDEKIQTLADKKGKLTNDIAETKQELRGEAEKIDKADKHLNEL